MGIYTSVSADNSRDFVYMSVPIESVDGSDLKNKILQDPEKYFFLRGDGHNFFSENTLTEQNWEDVLDTDFPITSDNSYWNSLFSENADKLDFEIIDGGVRKCHHYAAYIIQGAGEHVQSGDWTTSIRDVNNDVFIPGFEYCAVSGDGGWVQAPADDFIGYSGDGVLRFYIDRFPSVWGDTDDNDAWAVWTAQERAVAYSSIDESTGELQGVGTALCNHIDENWDKYLPWMVGYPSGDGGGSSDFCNIGQIMFPNVSNGNGWSEVPNSRYVKLNGQIITADYTWGTNDNPVYITNEKVTISGLGTDYRTAWWNEPGNPIGWVPYDGVDIAPDMSRQDGWTNPSAGGLGFHLNHAVAQLLGVGACQYHTSDAHVDFNNMVYGWGSYNLSVDDWVHETHFYILKVYIKNDRTVTYDKNGGEGLIPSQTDMVGSPIVLKENGFSRVGYHFDSTRGWNTEPNGTGIHYPQGSLYLGDDDLTLYAQWSRNRSDLVVDPNSGVYNGSYGVTYHNGLFGDYISVLDPIRDNYTFTGWHQSEPKYGTYDLSSKVYTFGPTDNVVDYYTAIWEPNIYRIDLDKRGGSGGSNVFFERYATSFNSTQDVTSIISSIYVPSRSGYIFEGYYTTSTGTNGTDLPVSGIKAVGCDGTILVPNTYFTNNSTLYALWRPIRYNVNIYNNKPQNSTGDIGNIK